MAVAARALLQLRCGDAEHLGDACQILLGQQVLLVRLDP
jgi:hypothetical protein